MEVLKNFLKRFSSYFDNDEYISVFVDESFIHSTHSCKKSYVRKGKGNQNIERPSGKGKRLVIIHAITKDGPLTDRVGGVPIDHLQWGKGRYKDTPTHVYRPDGLVNCETLWIASSNKGDYHDNMNSTMFMEFIEKKLVPCFEQKYPKKKMVLVADNAPYHHKRKIGSLGSKKCVSW